MTSFKGKQKLFRLLMVAIIFSFTVFIIQFITKGIRFMYNIIPNINIKLLRCVFQENTVDENIIATIKMRNNLCYPLENGKFSNIALAILDFSLLLPI